MWLMAPQAMEHVSHAAKAQVTRFHSYGQSGCHFIVQTL